MADVDVFHIWMSNCSCLLTIDMFGVFFSVCVHANVGKKQLL